MEATQRREEILDILRGSTQPVSASTIAGRFNVSRQIIVGDIALLRAANHAIAATPRGYILADATAQAGRLIKTVACRHGRDDLLRELYVIVDNGCGIIDVIVEHVVYGQISGQLHLFSRYDADCFMEKLEKEKALPLCDLTGGVHLHTLSCPSEEAYERVLSALRKDGILFER
ncbi:transcription repressor NadR [Caproiciproducens galactitolivorans]|uniref:Putative transcription repressor NiaR n=1 Tax=Caproiciproducens galactitolivorans TaxID=642589 RepID=A0A4Z0YAI7_9FIRM|nr:transcription repressor NadR [Caproiciproducens galactitolivorans]QEY34771.1 transcription repressor NadR [Caproiciproducens galactitolivorans]TGJ75980.1 putative transcription repressor NiaR [Caproiciproducens galactitolivorans]